MTPSVQAENPKGRIDVLILRVADELGQRLHAETTIDLRTEVREAAQHLIKDMGLPRTPITPTTVVRSLLGIPDRAATSGRRKTNSGRLRRVK